MRSDELLGSPLYVPGVSVDYWCAQQLDTQTGTSVTVTHPEGSSAIFSLDQEVARAHGFSSVPELKKAVGATVADVMSSDPVTADAGMSVAELATLMVDRDVSRVPVLDGEALVGIVSKSDIVRSLIAEG